MDSTTSDRGGATSPASLSLEISSPSEETPSSSFLPLCGPLPLNVLTYYPDFLSAFPSIDISSVDVGNVSNYSSTKTTSHGREDRMETSSPLQLSFHLSPVQFSPHPSLMVPESPDPTVISSHAVPPSVRSLTGREGLGQISRLSILAGGDRGYMFHPPPPHQRTSMNPKLDKITTCQLYMCWISSILQFIFAVAGFTFSLMAAFFHEMPFKPLEVFHTHSYNSYIWLVVELLTLPILLLISCCVTCGLHLYVCWMRTKKSLHHCLRVSRPLAIVCLVLSLSYISPICKLSILFCSFAASEYNADDRAIIEAKTICGVFRPLVVPAFIFMVAAAMAQFITFTAQLEKFFKGYAFISLSLLGLSVSLFVLGIVESVDQAVFYDQIGFQYTSNKNSVFETGVTQQLSLFFRTYLELAYFQGSILACAGIFGLYIAYRRTQLLNVVNILTLFALAFIGLICAGSATLPSAIITFFCQYTEYPLPQSEIAVFRANHLCLRTQMVKGLWVCLLSGFILIIFFFIYAVLGQLNLRPRSWKHKVRLATFHTFSTFPHPKSQTIERSGESSSSNVLLGIEEAEQGGLLRARHDGKTVLHGLAERSAGPT